MVTALLFASLLLPSCANAPAQSAFPENRPLPTGDPVLQALLDDYDRYFSGEMALTMTPGAAVVIVKGGEVVFMRGYGVKNTGKPDSVDAHTLFRIGSLSKGFAGVLTGMLVQDSLFQWDDPVQKYFPEFTLRDPKQAARIRPWHLLSHTTGLPYHAYTNLIERGFDIRKIVTEFFPKAPVSGKEGEFFSYQNAAFCAIEEVMRKVTGKSYQQLLVEKIFLPAGMQTASCDYQSMQQAANKALPHFQTGHGWRVDEVSPLYYNAAAAGGVNASISDMGEWLKLLLGHQAGIVADATLERVFRPVVKTGKERRIFPGWIGRDEASYALGWRVLEHGADTIIYHGGYVNGYKGEIAFNRRDGIGICVLFNANSSFSNKCIPAFFERWKKQ
ncbi:MAG: beta-lactamase family protein [Lewinellaceae bacterium]|nr:beta-lactamase family protein [Lewinellaceae bacterium]